MIFYFSATGNCKYAAECIAKAASEECISVTEILAAEKKSVSVKKGECVGIVSPTYAWGIPSVVVDFLKTTTFTYEEKPYFYFIATYGTTPAHSGYFANKYLADYAKIEFDAYYGVKMPDTWTPIFDLSDKEKVTKINSNVEPQLDEIIKNIEQRKRGDFMKNKIPHFTAPFYKPYYEKMRNTSHFTVEDTCVSCGLCAKKCPVGAIELQEGKPLWTKSKCAMCLGCLHRCPKFAIQYGKNTKRHGQYRNPHVKV